MYTPLTIEPLLIALYTACLDIPKNTPASVWFVKDFISFVSVFKTETATPSRRVVLTTEFSKASSDKGFLFL